METGIKQKMIKSNFETSDLAVVAFLKASKIQITGTRLEGKRFFFQFTNPKAKSLALSYFNDAKIPASTFYRAFQDLKTIIFGRIKS